MAQEQEVLVKLAKRHNTRTFAYEVDAFKETAALQDKPLAKALFHIIEFMVQSEEKKRCGRPIKDTQEQDKEYIYRLECRMALNQEAVERIIKYRSTFVLAINDKRLRAEQILAEYKTQSSVEKKFQQLSRLISSILCTSSVSSGSKRWCI